MKKTLASIFVLCCCFFVSLRAEDYFALWDGIPNAQYFMQKNSVGNQYFFFIGNEALAGTGLRNPSLRYSAQMVQAFKRHYVTDIHETRYMYPGGSWFAQYRTSGGQAVFGEVICSGYLAILDFSIDDRGMDRAHVQRQLEGQFRQIVRYRPTHSTILLYTLTPEMLSDYRAGRVPDYITWCETVAEYYGVPTLNLAKFAADKILAGEISEEDFFQSGTSLPTDAGAKICVQAVNAFVDALCAAHATPDRAVSKTLPDLLFEKTNDNGRIVAYETTEFSEGWKSGQESPIKPFRHLLVTGRPGQSVTLKFFGTEAGILDVAAADSCALEYSLDGGAWQKITLSDPLPTEPTLRAVPLVEDLDRGVEHTLTVRTASEGTERFGGFLLNGTTADPYAGLDTLARIDKIYAAMEPLAYTPEPDRFRYLPKTMKKLRDGGTLRMVLLGDSIMGNTAASNFELLIERDYPRCDIVKIASLRSSTGCKYYQDENRVEDYVIRHQPDILLIGGISNGGDWEAIRSVVRQCRAKLPELEILLITPVFGAVQDAHIKNWELVPAEAQNPFRYNLRKVAEEEHCAFFDMTAPWWSYIQSTGKTYGWFMGDSVHANARGCQIIGRLLERYFQE